MILRRRKHIHSGGWISDITKTYRRFHVLWLVIVISIGLLGCGQEPALTTQTGFSGTNEPVDTISAHNNFLTQKEYSPGGLTALLMGKLVFENGWLQVKRIYKTNESPGEAHEVYTVIWPYGYSLSTAGNRIQVLDDKGQPKVRLGELISLGGGIFDPNVPNYREFIEKRIGKPIPSGIPGLMWLAASTELDTYLPTQVPDYRNQPYPSDSMDGLLVIERTLLRLEAGYGKKYLAIWPNGYSYHTGLEGGHQIYDENDQRVAEVGNAIKLAGGEISGDVVEKYIGVSLPPTWQGPYWLVSDVIGISK